MNKWPICLGSRTTSYGGPSHTQPLRMANPVITVLDDRYICSLIQIIHGKAEHKIVSSEEVFLHKESRSHTVRLTPAKRLKTVIPSTPSQTLRSCLASIPQETP